MDIRMIHVIYMCVSVFTFCPVYNVSIIFSVLLLKVLDPLYLHSIYVGDHSQWLTSVQTK